MLRKVCFAIIAVASLSLATTAPAAEAQGKRHATRQSHGYGFLPGYQPPEQLERYRYHYEAPSYWYWGGRYYFGSPRSYRGRWNGGSFGPCWTQTPIGPMWNCG